MLATHDKMDKRLRNAVLGSEFRLRDAASGPPLTDGQYVGVTQLARCLVVGATFRDLVSHVVGVCARKQVSWVAAWRVVAIVEHEKTIWDRAVREHIGGSVCQFPPVLLASETHPAVSTWEPFTLPFPALIWAAHSHFLKKAVTHRPTHRSVIARVRAVAIRFGGLLDGEFSAAVFTNRGTLSAHSGPPSQVRGAMLRAVTAAPELSHALNYTGLVG